MNFSLFVVISLIYLVDFSKCDDNEDKLLAVSVVFRHGDRNPTWFYENDPYKDDSYWPEGAGQLINAGKRRHLELGKWFRERYNGFLSEKYSEREIKIISTDVDRTLMSAAANLAGLYPPKDEQIWDEDLLWQPMPIHTKPTGDDALLAMSKNCPKYNRLLDELFDSEYFQQIQNDNQELYEYLTNNTGSDIKTIENINSLYDTLLIEDVYFNFTLPEWTNQVYPEPLLTFSSLHFSVYAYTEDLARLITGPFFYQLLDNFQEKVNNPTDTYHKFRVFSAHDSTIADLLTSMNVFDGPLPPYSSSIMFELRQSNADNDFYYVNILYKNFTDTLHNIQLNGCDFNCNFDDFLQIIQPISVDLSNWEIECQDNNYNNHYHYQNRKKLLS